MAEADDREKRRAAITAAVEAWIVQHSAELLGCEVADASSVGFDSISAEKTESGGWEVTVDGYLAAGDKPRFGAAFLLRGEGDGSWGVRRLSFAKGPLEWRAQTTPWNATYRGSVRGSSREGRGLWRHPGGESYEGEWRGGKRHGWGRYCYEDGARYHGEWRDGLMEGKGVYYLTTDGTEVYVGGYKAGCKHGPGLYANLAPSAARFALQDWDGGQLRSDSPATPADQVNWLRRQFDILRQAEAVARSPAADMDDDDPPDDPVLIAEEFARETQQREHTFPSGAVYVGDFAGESSKKHGTGKWTHPQGDAYEGQFAHNTKEGWGAYCFKSMERTYFGSWRKDKMDGWGVLLFKGGDYCVGQFCKDERWGQCAHFLPSGECKMQSWADAELKEEKELPRDGDDARAYAEAHRLIRAAVQAVAPTLG